MDYLYSLFYIYKIAALKYLKRRARQKCLVGRFFKNIAPLYRRKIKGEGAKCRSDCENIKRSIGSENKIRR